MFSNTKAFSGFSVNDLEKARAFYQEQLGLETEGRNEHMFTLKLAGGTPILVYAKPNHVPATFTILNFQVSNVEEVVDKLSAKGIKFLQYTGPIATDAKGIHRANGEGPTVAWFADPAGNILSVVEGK